MTAGNVCSRGTTVALVKSETRSAWKTERISLSESKTKNKIAGEFREPATVCFYTKWRRMFGVDLLLKGNFKKTQRPRKLESLPQAVFFAN